MEIRQHSVSKRQTWHWWPNKEVSKLDHELFSTCFSWDFFAPCYSVCTSIGEEREPKNFGAKKDAVGAPQSFPERTLLGEGRAGLDAQRQAMQTAPRGETPEKISVSRLPITRSDARSGLHIGLS
jgi:hypothetical protein